MALKLINQKRLHENSVFNGAQLLPVQLKYYFAFEHIIPPTASPPPQATFSLSSQVWLGMLINEVHLITS